MTNPNIEFIVIIVYRTYKSVGCDSSRVALLPELVLSVCSGHSVLRSPPQPPPPSADPRNLQAKPARQNERKAHGVYRVL